IAYGIPFISGKDSLHNQFTNTETGQVIRIPNTLLISAIGVIEDVRKCVTMDLKQPGNRLSLVMPKSEKLRDVYNLHHSLSAAIASGRIVSCHDVSDGGLFVAIAEMCIASGLGCEINDEPLTSDKVDVGDLGWYVIETEEFANIEYADVLHLGSVTQN